MVSGASLGHTLLTFLCPSGPYPMSIKDRLLHRGLYLSIQVGFKMHVGIRYSREHQDKC